MDWTPFLVALIPALGALVAAIVAAKAAGAARSAEARERRVLELERRLALHKEEMYEPMIEFFRKLLDSAVRGEEPSQSEAMDALSRFGTWVQVYGSDDAVRAFHKFTQASYASAPTAIAMRYYLELMFAIRRELGDPDTQVSLLDLAGIRLNDAHDSRWRDVFVSNENDLLAQEGWSPPWRDAL